MSRSFARPSVLLPPLVLLIAWAALLWWPSRVTVANEEDRLADLQTEQMALVGEIDKLNEAEGRLDEFELDLVRFATAVPPTSDLGALLRVLHAEAEDVELELDLFAPIRVADSTTAAPGQGVPPNLSSVSLALSGIGTYEAALAFVGRLEAMDRLVVVDSLVLTAADGPNRIIIDVNLRVFTTEPISDVDDTLSFDLEDES